MVRKMPVHVIQWLSFWTEENVCRFAEDIFVYIFSIVSYFDTNVTEVCSWGSNYQYTDAGDEWAPESDQTLL